MFLFESSYNLKNEKYILYVFIFFLSTYFNIIFLNFKDAAARQLFNTSRHCYQVFHIGRKFESSLKNDPG